MIFMPAVWPHTLHSGGQKPGTQSMAPTQQIYLYLGKKCSHKLGLGRAVRSNAKSAAGHFGGNDQEYNPCQQLWNQLT